METLAEQRRGRAGRLRYGNGEYVKACQERIKQKSSENHPNKMIFGTFGPSVEIRTQGLLNPIQARYQTSPHPDFLLSVAVSRRLVYNSTVGNGMQVFFSLFSFFSKFLSSHPLPHPFCQNRPSFPLFSPGRLGKKLDSILCSVLHSVQKIFLLEMLQIVHNFRKNLLFLLPALPFSNCFTVRWQKF